MVRRLARLAAASAVAATLLAASGTPAAAACDGPVPSFRGALSTAKRIVIGDVVAVRDGGLTAPGSDGRASRFILRVRYVLRGNAPAVMELRDLPTQPCAPRVIARAGDRIALAFDATAALPPFHVNTVAWIRGTPPDFVGIETIAVAEAFRLLRQDPPDTATAVPDVPYAPPLAPLLVLVAGLVGAVLGWWRVGSCGQPRRFRTSA